ncbi:methyl-accepting chemotaxis protein [Vreelandella aquamarina]
MRLRMTAKLVITSSGLLALAIIGISMTAIFQVRQMAVENFNETSSQQLKQVDYSLTGFLDQIAHNVDYMAAEPSVRSVYGEITDYMDTTETVAMTPKLNSAPEAALFDRYERFAKSHPELAYVYLATADGGYMQWPQSDISGGYDPRVRPFYQTAIENPGKAVRTDAYYFAEDDVSIVSTVRTIEDEQGEVLGVQGMDVSLSGLTEMIRNIEFGEQGYLMLIEASGTILVNPRVPEQNFRHVDELDSPELAKLHDAAILGESYTTQVMLNDRNYQTTVFGSPGLGWTLVGVIPRSEMMATANRLTWILIVLGLVVIGLCAAASYGLARYLTGPVRVVSQQMKNIATGEGDMTQRLPVRSDDEVGELAKQFNAFVERMQLTLIKVRTSKDEVLDSSDKLAMAVGELSTRTEEAAANLQETSAAMEEINSTVAHTAEAADQANGLATNTATTAREGYKSIEVMQAKMSAISTSASNISEITGLIDSIAFQTNILALNASVEAARAGEQGRGFAVVASEVRKLAGRASDAAKNIHELVDNSVRLTQEGSVLLEQVVANMRTIQTSVTQVSDVIGEITAGTREQSTGISEVNVAVTEMDTMTQQNATMVSKSSILASGMHDAAQDLDRMLSVFVLGDDAQPQSQSDTLSKKSHALSISQVKSAKASVSSKDKDHTDDWESF